MKSIFQSQIFWLAIVNLGAVVLNYFFPDVVIDTETQEEIVALPWTTNIMNALFGLLLIAARFITVSPVKGVAPANVTVPVAYSTDFKAKLNAVINYRPVMNVLVAAFAIVLIGMNLARFAFAGWIGWTIAAAAGIGIYLLLRKERPEYDTGYAV